MTSIEELQHLHPNEICGIATYEALPAHYPIHNIGRRHSGLLYTVEGEELECPRNPQMVFKMKLPQHMPPMSFVRHAVELSAKD